ncbi:Ribulose bisphosphate carboxylase, chloroplastic [Symbiodinium microadriaticum]|uniref:Ribulose bisphosphate carboxylase, chloroplastic n=1 Tax=Symbiodinium microadriaticum TaxID=2951 RepID=A0A1Q9EMA5_SYMMI|nr:Ribulose bisphosphate carboxylase, chloroplastic [Symbiodinium microadriaticum]
MAMKDATYAFQKDAYADLEFTNDVGYLPDGTPLNKAGNALNHPETIGADKHVAGSPLPRAKFVNSVGYLPDGTPMNAAGNAINHPETMQPDPHMAGSPLPPSSYAADVGYLVDGTPLETAGNNSVKGAPATPPPAAAAAFVGSSAPAAPMAASAPPPAAAPTSPGTAMHGRKFEYSFQKDAYADQEFCNDVGYLPDGTPLNRAGNAINHPENIGPDSHAPGSPLPRAIFVNSVGYLPDGTPLNRAGNNINHPESIGPDLHAPGSPLPASVYAADVGYLVGYLVDGTPLETAGNNSVKNAPPPAAPAAAPSAPVAAAAFVGSSAAPPKNVRIGAFDFAECNDVGYLPDGTAINRAGNAINHPENIQPDRTSDRHRVLQLCLGHAPGSPLPRANFVNDVGYLPDGTPLNKAGNAVNHPETIQPDMHTPGSALPASTYAADVGYLVDGTPMDRAGNLSVQ